MEKVLHEDETSPIYPKRPPGKGAVLSELPFKARNTLTRLPEARSARAIHRLAIGPSLPGDFQLKQLYA